MDAIERCIHHYNVLFFFSILIFSNFDVVNDGVRSICIHDALEWGIALSVVVGGFALGFRLICGSRCLEGLKLCHKGVDVGVTDLFVFLATKHIISDQQNDRHDHAHDKTGESLHKQCNVARKREANARVGGPLYYY